MKIPDESSQSQGTDLWLPRLAAGAGAIYLLQHVLRILFGSEYNVMEWLYDDTFYYMITAAHFSREHLSSFDGVTVTSGYHPLWMWLCALVYSLRGHLDLTYVRSCMALAFCISASVLASALYIALRPRNSSRSKNGLLWTLALAASSYSALNNSMTVMEWPLVLLCAFLLYCLMLGNLTRGRLALAFLIGIAGTLSRTDFGLISASWLAAALLLGLRRGIRTYIPAASAATLGSFLGLPLVLWYYHHVTGDWLQSSARVKHLAASLSTPFNPVPAIWQFLRVLLYLPPLDIGLDVKASLLRRGLIALIIVLVLMAALAVAQRERLLTFLAKIWPVDPPRQLALTAAIFGTLGYLFLDGFNTQATYGWYSASVTVFIVVLTACLLGSLRTSIAAAIVFPLMLANFFSAQYFGGNSRTQMIEVVAGKALHHDHPGAVLGGGDVGKPSFYNQGTMFNLDGLMNNEVVPYLETGRLHCYILKRHIEYLAGVGTITIPISNSERIRHGETPIPWLTYFTVVSSGDQANPNLYFRTDFAAIRASGECPATN